jgi:hypothetical protein
MEDRGHLIFVQFVRNSLLLHSARPERHAVFAARNAAAVARQPADQNEAQKKKKNERRRCTLHTMRNSVQKSGAVLSHVSNFILEKRINIMIGRRNFVHSTLQISS